MPKEHPIIMSAESVRAIQADRKTMTRRVIVLQPIINKHNRVIYWTEETRKVINEDLGEPISEWESIACLFGKYKVGDLLWVRETWAKVSENKLLPTARTIIYKASKDEMIFDIGTNWKPSDFPIKWRPSSHMSKWAARLWLEITGIRVERVQDISVGDIISEGIIERNVPYAKKKDLGWYYYKPWRNLWDSLNAKRGYGWDKNPWVWVIEFKRYPNA